MGQSPRGEGMNPLYHRPAVNIDAMLHFVREKIGAASGEPHHHVHWDGFRLMAEETITFAEYNSRGAGFAAGDLRGWIMSYIMLDRDLLLHPEIAEVSIEKPHFLVGFGRTGSTFLHHLLALDPQFRAPRLWELIAPTPPPRPETAASDPRIALTTRILKLLEEICPLTLQMHPTDALAPEECRWIIPHGANVAVQILSPRYWNWLTRLDDGDLRAIYGHYLAQVRRLQLHYGARTWLAKSSSHLLFLPVLFDVFPDARVVRLHRDPREAVSSYCSLVTSMRGLYSDRVDTTLVGEFMLDLFVDGMARMIAAEERYGAERFADVHYGDLVRDPVGTVRGIYAQCGYDYTPEYDAALQRHLALPRPASEFRHRYAAEQFGLTDGVILDRSSHYLEWLATRREGARGAA
jgi:hypothetical protein